MITTESLLYDLDFKLNKVATNKGSYIPVEDKILVLNSAQIKLIKNKVGPDANYGLGLDGFKKKYEDLQNLIQPHTPFAVTKDKVGKLNKYLLDLRGVTPEWMFFIDCYFLADKGTCKNRIISAYRVKHADIHRILANSNMNPSFEYQETPLTVTDNYLEGYTDGTFDITTAYPSYLRYPQEIDTEGYTHLDGTPSVNRNCELREYLSDELIDLAVLELGVITANQNIVQGTQLINQNNDK